MERSLRRKMREDSRHRSPTPPPSSRGVPHGAGETTTESQLEVLEAPRNQQEKTSRPTAVPKMKGEETKERAPWDMSLHLQGPPRSKSGQEQEPSDESKPREKIWDKSTTPPPSSRGDHHGANEATTERQLEAVEAPRNRQEKVSGPTAVPRVEGKETEARASWGTSLHLQGPPGRKSGQE